MDATGVAAGLAFVLTGSSINAGPRLIVEPFVLPRASKGQLGWDFLGLIDGGRIKAYADDGEEITRVCQYRLKAYVYEVLPGPGRLLRWGVPASRGTTICW